MDIQAFIDTVNDQNMHQRSNYHMTFGDLITALKAANKDAEFDERVKGIGSYRGYYSDIALFTDESGGSVEDGEFSGDWDMKRYQQWQKDHVTSFESLPRNPHELAKLLESLIGKDFTGYKGGNFTITEDKPLWFENESSNSSGNAVIDITADLKLVTKVID